MYVCMYVCMAGYSVRGFLSEQCQVSYDDRSAAENRSQHPDEESQLQRWYHSGIAIHTYIHTYIYIFTCLRTSIRTHIHT